MTVESLFPKNSITFIAMKTFLAYYGNSCVVSKKCGVNAQ